MPRKILALADFLAAPIFFSALIAFWELSCRLFSIPSFLLPAPSAILAAGIGIDIGIWMGHIWSTLRVALTGYAIAIIVSIPLAVMLAGSRLMSRTVYPLLIIVQSTPVVAIAPILVVTLGANDAPRILITFLITFFPIVVSSVTGLLAVPEELIELSRSLRAGRWRETTQIRLPFAMPFIFSALKVSTTLSIIGAVVSELVAADKGLGYFIAFSTSMFRIPTAFSALFVLVALSLAFFQTVVLAQRLIAPWSVSSQR